jgi:hypothetical protein
MVPHTTSGPQRSGRTRETGRRAAIKWVIINAPWYYE